jgi:hypothetical protein
MVQLYPQAPSTHFSLLLRHALATVRLFFSPVTTRGIFITTSIIIDDDNDDLKMVHITVKFIKHWALQLDEFW